ncbi:OadG family protein [Methylomagnum sp.]
MEPTLPDLLLSGGKLMLIGMGIVYLFLALLVWIIGITAKLLRRYNPEPETLPARAGAGTASGLSEADVVAVIAAAIHRHRNR